MTCPFCLLFLCKKARNSVNLRWEGWESNGIIIFGLTPLRPAKVDTLSSPSWPAHMQKGVYETDSVLDAGWSWRSALTPSLMAGLSGRVLGGPWDGRLCHDRVGFGWFVHGFELQTLVMDPQIRRFQVFRWALVLVGAGDGLTGRTFPENTNASEYLIYFDITFANYLNDPFYYFKIMKQISETSVSVVCSLIILALWQ